MNVMKVTCGSCAGIGKQEVVKVVDTNGNIGALKREEVICEVCCGKGYTEYATLTLEEANAILKHCGLSTES